MRLRATVLAAALAGTSFVAFAAPADAVTTTSTTIAYVADTDGNGVTELYTRPADGSGSPSLVFTSATQIRLPALSPDGTRIAYLQASSTSASALFRLYVRPANGSGAATLLSNGDATSPSWSWDGTKIVFARYNMSTEVFAVYSVPATGGAHTLIHTTDVTKDYEPAFSPSGRQVAVTYTDWTSSSTAKDGIHLITLAGGSPRSIVAGTLGGGSDPVWSPDGRYLLFQKPLGCGYGLYRVPATGGTPVPIRVREGYFAGSAEYSRDGTQVFWSESRFQACNPGTSSGDIWVANADGTSPVRITPGAGTYEHDSTVAGGTLAVDTTPPAAPVIDAAGFVYQHGAKIFWTSSDDDATEYAVIPRTKGDPAPTSYTDTDVQRHTGTRNSYVEVASGQDHDLYVFAIDASGNASPASLPHSARPTETPRMTAIPRVAVASATSPKPSPWTAFTVAWTGNATSYQVDVGKKIRNATTGVWSTLPAYSTLLASTSDTSTTFNGAQGHTYYFRARGQDAYGNVTAYAARSNASVPLNETWSGLSYGTGWGSVASTSRYLDTYKYATGANRTVTAKTDTQRFTVIGDRCAACGAFKVYVDGVLKATIDTYASTTQPRQALYTGGVFSKISSHTIKIVTVGTAGRSRVDLDGLTLLR
jgi:hypothetical protein